MRVLQVSSLWPPDVLGGAELYAADLTDHLRAAGHEVGVVTFGIDAEGVIATVPPWPYPLQDFARQTPWRRAAFRIVDVYNRRAAEVLTDAVRHFQPDVVHSHSVAGLSTAVLTAASQSPAAHVHHLHDYWLLCRRTTLVKRSGRSCTRRCASCRAISASRSLLLSRHRPDLLIAPSDSIAEGHARLSWTAGRIRRLDHPVDVVSTQRTRPVPGSGQPVTFGYAGQLTAPKGVPTLLQAFAPLADDGHRLLVAGRGPLLDTVRSASRGVIALGWVEAGAKEAFYDDIDCLVIPSEWPENAPLVALEARGHGVPVIGARIGGIPELVDRRSTPLLFAAGDATGLETSLRRFVADPDGFSVSTDVTMSWPRHLAALVGLYGDAIAGHPPA